MSSEKMSTKRKALIGVIAVVALIGLLTSFTSDGKSDASESTPAIVDTTPTDEIATTPSEFDGTPPLEPTIFSGPALETYDTDSTFVFRSAQPGVTFECSLDGATFRSCASPHGLIALRPGDHRLEVLAVSPSGVRSDAATHLWLIKEAFGVDAANSSCQLYRGGANFQLRFTGVNNGDQFDVRRLYVIGKTPQGKRVRRPFVDSEMGVVTNGGPDAYLPIGGHEVESSLRNSKTWTATCELSFLAYRIYGEAKDRRPLHTDVRVRRVPCGSDWDCPSYLKP